MCLTSKAQLDRFCLILFLQDSVNCAITFFGEGTAALKFFW